MPSTQGGGGGGGTGEMKEGIAPMVIQQIMDVDLEGVKIFNFKYGIVMLVAILRHGEVTSTRIIYKLEDHTGCIDAHLWLEEGNSEPQDPRIKTNKYVSVFGSVRNQNGTKAVMVFKITPVNSPNEVNTHLLEVLNTRYSAEEFSRKGFGADFGTTGQGFGESTSASTGNDNCGLTGKHLQVYRLIKENKSNEGISLKDLQKKLPKFSNQEIM